MTDLHSLDRRVLLVENRLQAHSDQLTELRKQTNDQAATLSKISKTLDRLLWIAIGASLFYSATTLGLFETLKRVVL